MKPKAVYIISTPIGGDIGEGPWDKRSDAVAFLRSQVGVGARVLAVDSDELHAARADQLQALIGLSAITE